MKNKIFLDFICEQVDLCKKGKNPYLIHEFNQSYFVVGNHQFYQGYSLLLYKKHVKEIHELEISQYLQLSKELLIATKAIFDTFSPWKMYHQCLGNQQQHIHWHIIPRYEKDPNRLEMPMTDFIKNEKNINDYETSPELAADIRNKVLKNINI